LIFYQLQDQQYTLLVYALVNLLSWMDYRRNLVAGFFPAFSPLIPGISKVSAPGLQSVYNRVGSG